MAGEERVNHGNWNINNLIVLGACHTPEFDPLMYALRDAEERLADYGTHVGRLPKPHLGNLQSLELQNEVNRRKAKVIEYLQKHPEIVVLGGR